MTTAGAGFRRSISTCHGGRINSHAPRACSRSRKQYPVNSDVVSFFYIECIRSSADDRRGSRRDLWSERNLCYRRRKEFKNTETIEIFKIFENRRSQQKGPRLIYIYIYIYIYI